VLALVLVGGGVTAAFVLPGMLGGSSDNADLSAVVDYRLSNPNALSRDHWDGPVQYAMNPPAGGPHNPRWQLCTGQVYPKPIHNEKAVHSLEHGAVWITYVSTLDAASVEKLAARVRGVDYLLMSPYDSGQRSPISLQAWGYQLAVTSADDKRIDAFIRKYRLTASVEPGAVCSGGDTDTIS
jgi:hypothetical protein